MPEKIYIVELDAINGAAIKKIEEVQQKMLAASDRMTKAFDRVNKTIETQTKRVGGAVNQFSKRDLGILTTQLAASTELTGKLGGQLSNLASGLLTGGFIGAAFAGFSALINGITLRIKDYDAAVEKLKNTKIDLATRLELYKEQLNELKEPGFWEGLIQGTIQYFGGTAGWIEYLINKQNELKTALASGMIMSAHGKGYLADLQDQLATKRSLQMSAVSKGEAMSYNREILEIQKKIDEVLGKQVEKNETIIQQYDIMEDIYKAISEDEDKILGNVDIGSGKFGTGRFDRIWDPKKMFFKEQIEEAQSPMTGLVSLSNQMASNFSFAGHTFVGQLSQAIAMVDSISNMILTVASIFGGGGGFGIGGLLSLIGLEKGGRITNLHGAITHTKIPSFAMGGSYSTPGFSGPMGGGYPVMVHKNETLDVYNSGQTSRMERTLGEIKTILYNTGLNSTKKRGGGSGPIIIKVGDKVIAEVIQSSFNKMRRSGVNLEQL